MSIQLQCENCGKYVKAPREAAGRQAKCPACGHSIYIPNPADEVEELPLAPEDSEDVRREQALLEERRRLDRILSREDRAPVEGGTGTRPSGSREAAGSRDSGSFRMPASLTPGGAPGQDLEELVIDYLGAMRDSDLDRAHEALAHIQRRRDEARRIVDRLAADQIPPPQMTRVPPAVYQGFLKNLRAQL
jgi:hypothetical protein